MPTPRGFDHALATKLSSTHSIAAHTRQERKDGAPSVEMLDAKTVKRWAQLEKPQDVWADLRAVLGRHPRQVPMEPDAEYSQRKANHATQYRRQRRLQS